MRTKVVDDPERIMPVHERLQEVVDRVEGRAVTIQALERFDFSPRSPARLLSSGPRTPDPMAASSCARASSELAVIFHNDLPQRSSTTIFHHAEHPDDIAGYRPAGSGQMLVTSRYPGVAEPGVDVCRFRRG